MSKKLFHFFYFFGKLFPDLLFLAGTKNNNYLEELWMVLPPNKIRVPPGPPAASVASFRLSNATARASSYVVPPSMKMIISCGLGWSASADPISQGRRGK